MLLEGSIHRFRLPSILQFLAQNAATGVLELRDFEEYGFVYLVNGRVEAISLPISDERLGTHLLKAGFLTEQQLAEILVEDATLTNEQRRLKPLGQRLLERGFTDEVKIREVLKRQLLNLVFELAHWQTGAFSYDEPEEMPHFKISIRADVQQLLLDAQRRIDQGERPRKHANHTQNEICFACPLERECSPAIKAKHLKNDVCLWRRMSAVVVDSCDSPGDARGLYRKGGHEVASLDAWIEW